MMTTPRRCTAYRHPRWRRWAVWLVPAAVLGFVTGIALGCTVPRDTPHPPTRVDVQARPGCEPISEATVRAELDAVAPGWEGALWPGFSVTLWPGRAVTSEPAWIIVDCDLGGLAEEVERLVAGREGAP